jgi:tetratricopeptide (TPR) repeat protein
VSGACAKVIYGYANRGLLDPNDGTWFRQQFSPYGPIPVALAFGPAFSRYLGDTNGWRSAADEGDRLGDTLRHHRELRDVVEHMPDSIWAPSAAELLGRLTSRQGATVEERIAIFQRVADRYPHSPYVDVSIREEARVLDGAEQLDSARAEYEKMLTLHPSSPFRLEALRYIVYNERSHHNLPGMLRWARKWLDGAPIQERFVAHSLIAEALLAQDDVTGAKNEAKKTLESASAFEQAMRDNRIQASPSSLVKWQREAQQARQEARAIEQRP